MGPGDRQGSASVQRARYEDRIGPVRAAGIIEQECLLVELVALTNYNFRVLCVELLELGQFSLGNPEVSPLAIIERITGF